MNFFRFPKMAISLPLATLAVAGLILVNEASYLSSSDAVADMEKAQLTRGALNNLMQIILDAETGQRGYLLTGDERYLEPFNNAIKQVTPQLDLLRQIFVPYKEQLTEFGTMSRQLSRKLVEMDL